jgi:hypothetical protein
MDLPALGGSLLSFANGGSAGACLSSIAIAKKEAKVDYADFTESF